MTIGSKNQATNAKDTQATVKLTRRLSFNSLLTFPSEVAPYLPLYIRQPLSPKNGTRVFPKTYTKDTLPDRIMECTPLYPLLC